MVDRRFQLPPERISAPVAAGPEPPKAISPLAPVLRVVVLEPHLRRLLAPFQRRPFERRQIPQPGKIPPPASRLRELRFESLTFQTAKNTVRIATHRAPVENNEQQTTTMANKKQTLFFALCSPCQGPLGPRFWGHGGQAA